MPRRRSMIVAAAQPAYNSSAARFEITASASNELNTANEATSVVCSKMATCGVRHVGWIDPTTLGNKPSSANRYSARGTASVMPLT